MVLMNCSYGSQGGDVCSEKYFVLWCLYSGDVVVLPSEPRPLSVFSGWLLIWVNDV